MLFFTEVSAADEVRRRIGANKGFGSEDLPEKAKTPMKRLRIAVLVTGQLARLELWSKIERLIKPNMEAGHLVHTFMTLDAEVDKVKTTINYGAYINTPFRAANKRTLRTHIKTQLKSYPDFRVFLVFRKFQSLFTPIGKSKLDKMFTGNWKTDPNRVTPEMRFDVNMRMLSNIREGVRHMQDVELFLGQFYNLVVKVRDDSYLYDKWVLDASYMNFFSSLRVNSWGGVNDHDFVIDRKWADRFLRGVSEDYYLDFNVTGVHMRHSTEHYLNGVLKKNNIKKRQLGICDIPTIPLRTPNATTGNWRLHRLYVKNTLLEATRTQEQIANFPTNLRDGESLPEYPIIMPCFKEINQALLLGGEVPMSDVFVSPPGNGF